VPSERSIITRGRASTTGGPIADPVAGSRAARRGAVTGIREPAPAERETSAPDTFGEPAPEALEFGDSFVDARCPLARQPRPVAARRDVIFGQFGQFGRDLVKRQPNPLREHDEGDPAQHWATEATVAGPCPHSRDKPPLLVEAKCGGGHPTAACDLSDRQ
jgi:hypothetical protein